MFNVLKFKSFYIFLIISSKWTKRLHATALEVLLHKWSVNHAHRGGIAAAALENQMEGHGDSISLFTLKKKKKKHLLKKSGAVYQLMCTWFLQFAFDE